MGRREYYIRFGYDIYGLYTIYTGCIRYIRFVYDTVVGSCSIGDELLSKSVASPTIGCPQSCRDSIAIYFDRKHWRGRFEAKENCLDGDMSIAGVGEASLLLLCQPFEDA